MECNDETNGLIAPARFFQNKHLQCDQLGLEERMYACWDEVYPLNIIVGVSSIAHLPDFSLSDFHVRHAPELFTLQMH